MTMSSNQPKICPTCDRPLVGDEPCPACLWSSVFSEDEVVEEGARELPLDVPGHAVLEEIARGGMGIVYRAREIEAGREVALKMLLPFQSTSEGMRERFRTEARAAAMLDHPHVLPVFQVGETAEWLYFTMKLAEGGTLAQRVEKFSGDWKAISQLVAQLADAVDFAHSRGVLHRDLKPGNVLFDKAGTAFVADFGLAKLMSGESDEMALLTRTNAVLGTPHYLSPEVADRGAAEATVSSDLYGLGAILYQLLAGGPPFRGESLTGLMAAIANTPPKSPRAIDAKVPRDLETICLKCLEKDPARRYGRVAELAADLRRWSDGQAIVARKVSPAERFWLLVKRHPWAAVVGLGLLGLAAVAAMQTARSLESGREAVAAREQAENELWNARIERARALRLSTEAGVRGPILEDLAVAARFRVSPKLRNEAIAALAMSDFKNDVKVFNGVWPDWMTSDPAGEHLLCFGNRDRRLLRLMRLTDGKILWEAEAGTERFKHFALRDDAAAALVVSGNGTLEMWDVGAENPRWKVAMKNEIDLSAYGWLPDGRVFVLQQKPGLTVLDPASGERLDERAAWGWARFAKRLRPAFDRARQTVAVIGSDYRKIELLTWPGLERIAPPFELGSEIFQIDLSPDGRQIAAGCWDGSIEVIDVATRDQRSMGSQDNPVARVNFSPDGRWIVTYYWGAGVRVWDASGLRLQREIPDVEPLGFAAESGQLFAQMRPEGVALRSIDASSVYRQFRPATIGAFLDVKVAPDGRWVVLAGEGGISCLNLRTGTSGIRLETERASRVTFGEDGSCFVLQRQRIQRWPAVDGESPLSGEPELVTDTSAHQPSTGVKIGERWALIGGSKSEIVTPGADRTDAVGMRAMPWKSFYCDASPDGRYIVTNTFTGEGTFIYEVKTGHRLRKLSEDNASARFSPDGKTLAVATARSVQLWDTESWQVRTELAKESFHWSDEHIAYRADGKWLAVAASRFIILLDAETLEEVARLTQPDPQNVHALDFSDDGSLLVAAGQGKNVMVWDLAELGRQLEAMGLGW